MGRERGTKRKIKHLPDDVVFDILSRLPVKSLGKFSAEILGTANRIRENYFSIFFSIQKDDLTVFYQRSNFVSFYRYDNIASCNGLLCTGRILSRDNNRYRIYVQNLAMRELLCLPFISDYVWKHPVITKIGIGFDFRLQKYKVVFWDTESDSNAMIITLGTNSWRKINDSPVEKHVHARASRATVYLNGASHWCTAAGIISFNFTEEKFGFIPFPADMLCAYTLCEIFLMEDQFCIVDERRDVAVLNMWLLVDYSKHEWARKQIHLQCRDSVGEVVPVREGEIFVDTNGTGNGKVYLCQYDKDGQIINSIEVPQVPHAPHERLQRKRCILCTESLVSLNHMDERPEEDGQPKMKKIPFWRRCRQFKFW